MTAYAPGRQTRARIVQYVAGHQALFNYSPTLRETADACGIALVSVHYHVQRLIRDGWLEMDYGRSRTLRLAARDGRPAVTIYEQSVDMRGEAQKADEHE